jgi:hypothetical protein
VSRHHNVFLSWSGERSRLVAEFLRDWISQVVQAAKPWMSESEVEKGTRSLDEISKALADIKVGIVCLTPENLERPWLLYEAGCLSKSIDERTRLCTYLIAGLEPSDVRSPLGMFQATRATKEETLKLLKTINRVVGDDPISEENLTAVFEVMWPKLEHRMATLPPPAEAVPPKRAAHDILNEILELGRAQAAQREKTKFIDTYIPTFKQFLPLLQRLIKELNRRNSQQINAILRHPVDTSLARSVEGNSRLNTFTFPTTLQNAMPTDPRFSSRSLDLVQMFGSSGAAQGSPPYSQLRLTVKGRDLKSGAEETFEISFTLEVDAARKLARYLEQLADDAERNQVQFEAGNIQTLQDVREALVKANVTPPDRLGMKDV